MSHTPGEHIITQKSDGKVWILKNANSKTVTETVRLEFLDL